MHRQPRKQDFVHGLQRHAHRLLRRRHALGARGRTAENQIHVCLPRRAERHTEPCLRHRQPEGARIYTTLFPCNECAKALIQSGISQVIYYEDKYADSDSVIASKRMFDMVGIRYTPYKRTGRGVALAL